MNFCDFNLQSRKSELHILALLCKKSLTDDSVFCPFHSKFAWSTDHKVCGRPTIGCLHDRPGKNFSIILTNHGHFGLFSTSLKFERGRPRWILSDSRSTWKIQIVSRRMQNASNVSMWGGADRCTVKLQGTACVRTLIYPLFHQWARG